MSRRFIFIIAATVVMLYFSIILFMLHPLHARSSSFMNNFSFRQFSNLLWCNDLRMRSPRSQDVVALVSYPGSGNTWLRYLLQQVTGIMTGSIYMDHGLRLHGFPAENVSDGSVLVVKTHELPNTMPDKFKSAILLIRNPRNAIMAEFNRLHKGHIGTAPKSAYKTKANVDKKLVLDWSLHVSSHLEQWESLHQTWLQTFPGPIHVVFYENLVQDTKNILRGILSFLNYNVTEPAMKCTLTNREGIYRRRKKYHDFDPFTPEMYDALDGARGRVLRLVAEYQEKHNITESRRQLLKI